jgi:hypothetical protein
MRLHRNSPDFSDLGRRRKNISVVSAIHMVSETIQIIFLKYKYFDEF